MKIFTINPQANEAQNFAVNSIAYSEIVAGTNGWGKLPLGKVKFTKNGEEFIGDRSFKFSNLKENQDITNVLMKVNDNHRTYAEVITPEADIDNDHAAIYLPAKDPAARECFANEKALKQQQILTCGRIYATVPRMRKDGTQSPLDHSSPSVLIVAKDENYIIHFFNLETKKRVDLAFHFNGSDLIIDSTFIPTKTVKRDKPQRKPISKDLGSLARAFRESPGVDRFLENYRKPDHWTKKQNFKKKYQ